MPPNYVAVAAVQTTDRYVFKEGGQIKEDNFLLGLYKIQHYSIPLPQSTLMHS
jgi:hypothetical protein